jgi:1-acyl-sn-glycerol-3-phosphate acyltransferase
LFNVSRIFKGLIRVYNAIPVSGTQGLRTGVKLLKQGRVVVIFPEGTRSRKRTLLPFNPGVSYLAVTLGVPVIPAYITNSNKRFITLMLRINQLRIRFGSPVYPEGYLKNVKDFERFSKRIREEVLKLK